MTKIYVGEVEFGPKIEDRRKFVRAMAYLIQLNTYDSVGFDYRLPQEEVRRAVVERKLKFQAVVGPEAERLWDIVLSPNIERVVKGLGTINLREVDELIYSF